jgi:hypothetical protein
MRPRWSTIASSSHARTAAECVVDLDQQTQRGDPPAMAGAGSISGNRAGMQGYAWGCMSTPCRHARVEVSATIRAPREPAEHAGEYSGVMRSDQVGSCLECGCRVTRFRRFAQWSPWQTDG